MHADNTWYLEWYFFNILNFKNRQSFFSAKSQKATPIGKGVYEFTMVIPNLLVMQDYRIDSISFYDDLGRYYTLYSWDGSK